MILEQVKKLATKVLVRFKGKDYLPDGPIRFGWHIHHDFLVEPLIEPIRDRVRWIMYHKCAEEIPIRLKWMRPEGTRILQGAGHREEGVGQT